MAQRSRDEKPEQFADGVLDEEDPRILDAMSGMIRNGYSDDKIMQVVGATRSMVEKRRAFLEEQKK